MAQAAKGNENSYLKFGILIVLLLSLSFVLVHFNVVSCGFYSQLGCDVYYSIIAGGKPKVLIVHSDSGMGDPDYLFEVLKSPRFGARVSIKELNLVSLPELSENQLVIVEKAKVMGIEEFRIFEDYVNRGGRLVWVGDAGTAAPETESDKNYFLQFRERKAGGSADYIGPWARKRGKSQVSFDYLIGVDFRANYCEISDCTKDEIVGNLDVVNAEKKHVYGLSQGLPLYGDFSIVQTNDSAYASTLAYLEYGSSLTATPFDNYFWLKQGKLNFGKEFPYIVSSGVGGRVAYYAFPPEFVVSDKMPIDKKTGERVQYWAIMENMYYAMLYK